MSFDFSAFYYRNKRPIILTVALVLVIFSASQIEDFVRGWLS